MRNRLCFFAECHTVTQYKYWFIFLSSLAELWQRPAYLGTKVCRDHRQRDGNSQGRRYSSDLSTEVPTALRLWRNGLVPIWSGTEVPHGAGIVHVQVPAGRATVQLSAESYPGNSWKGFVCGYYYDLFVQ